MRIGCFPVIWALWAVYLFPQLIGLGPDPWKHVGCPHGPGSLLGLLLSLTLYSLVFGLAFWACVLVCLVPISCPPNPWPKLALARAESLLDQVRPPRGWLGVAKSRLRQHRPSYDIDGFSIFALNSDVASITFRDILCQLLCVPLFLSPLLLWVWICPISKRLCLLLRIAPVFLPS